VKVYEVPDGLWTSRAATEVVEPEPTRVYDSFHAYVLTLPPWEADLLHHATLEIDPAYLSLDPQSYFYAGSDSSVTFETNGAFGWMLANIDGGRVASAMGPARGAKMDSYRAECTGMLSFLRFLINMSSYTNNVDGFWRGVIGTDSQSMLDRLFVKEANASAPKQLAILDVLDPEWDLLVEIQEALRDLPGVDLVYVKGHQDDRKEYAMLPLMTQLNVDADRLAGKYNREYGANRPFSFMAANTGAILQTEEGTLTAKFGPELRLRSTSPGLEEYIRTKNQWDHATFQAVNWAAHGKAVKASLPNRVYLTKFLHDALPTSH
jgi:hypothetical protein